MAILLPADKTWYNSLTDALQQGASGYGQGMSAGLQTLAQHKLNQMTQQQEAERLTPIAKSLGHPEYNVLGVNNLAKLLEGQQEQSFKMGDLQSYNKATETLDNWLSTGRPPIQQPKTAETPIPVNNQPMNVFGKPTVDLNIKSAPVAPPVKPEMANEQPAERQSFIPKMSYVPGVRPTMPNLPSFNEVMSYLNQQGIKMSDQKRKDLHDYYNEDIKNAKSDYKMAMDQYNEDRKFDAAEAKEGGKVLSDAREKAQAADDKINLYKRLGAYVQSGELRTGPGAALLKDTGLENLVLNPSERGFRSTINSLILEKAAQMKGNLSDKDINFLQATLPSLADTEEGLGKMFLILQLTEEINRMPYEAMRSLTKKGAKSPSTIADDAYDIYHPKAKIYGSMIMDLARGKDLDMETNSNTGERRIKYRGQKYSF